MRAATLLVTLGLTLTVLSGCLGNDAEGFDFVPGQDWKPTGRTVHLKATILDLTQKELYPGLEAMMWAFCFKPADPDDAYSAAAIEYAPDDGVEVSEQYSQWQGTCSTPGPTLRFQQGDTIIVDFQNNHVHPHTIHWHGQYVPWESDGVPGSTQDSVRQGENFRYEFVASRAGTLWYHCHVDTQFHVPQGLYGVMIVEPQDTSWEPDVDKEMVWVLSGIERSAVEATPERIADPHADHKGEGGCGATGEQGCQNPPIALKPDVFMINGVSFPKTMERDDIRIDLDIDERIRLRLLNAGSTIEALHPHGHDLLVTHIDGNPLPPGARYTVDTLPIAPGQRIDVVLEGRPGNEGAWVFHTHMVSHVTNDRQYPGGMLTKIVYPGYHDVSFAGELPGGQPYSTPEPIPADHEHVQKVGPITNTTLQPHASAWTFDVTRACSVEALRLAVDADAPMDALQAQNDLAVSIIDPEGNQLDNVTVGNARYTNWTFDPATAAADEADGRHLVDGTYTVRLAGTALQTLVRMHLEVDHFATHEALEVSGMCAEHDH